MREFGTTGVRGSGRHGGRLHAGCAGAQAAERLPPRDPEEVSAPGPGLVSPSLDALARDAGWLMARPAEDLNIGDLEDVIVFGAVPWSAWDIEAAQALHAYAREIPALVVVLFNIDDEYNADSGGSEGLCCDVFQELRSSPTRCPSSLDTEQASWCGSSRVELLLKESSAWLDCLPERRSPTP